MRQKPITRGLRALRRFVPGVALCAVLLILCAGCSGSFRQVNFVAKEDYRSANLPADLSAERLSLLTAAGGDGGIEYRRLLGDIFEETLRARNPEVKLLPYWQSLSVINMHGLGGDYAGMLANYSTTGVLDKNVLVRLADALGVEFFLQPRLVRFRQSDSTRFSLLGLRMFTTFESRIKVYLELWHARTGEILWIGSGEAIVAHEDYKAGEIRFEEVARVAVENIVGNMPWNADGAGR